VSGLAETLYGKLLDLLTTPTGGDQGMAVGGHMTVDSFADRATNIAKLIAACDDVVSRPDFSTRDITGDGKPETFCNRASRAVAIVMGFMGFREKENANTMIGVMSMSPSWREDTMDRAVDHAKKGGLAFACIDDFPHGHICAVRPEDMEYSSTWGGPVAIVANVGKTNGRMRLSGAIKADDKNRVRFFLLGEV